MLKRSGDIVSFSRGLLSSLVTIGFDLVLILVLSIYMLIYGRQIGELVRRVMPSGDGTPEDDYPLLVQHAVSGYVRGQLLFSLVMGASAAIVLTIFGLVGIFPDGERYAIFFGAFYGLMEFIPYVGPIIGPDPAAAAGAVPASDRRGVADHRLHRAAAARGPCRRARRCSASRCGSTRS